MNNEERPSEQKGFIQCGVELILRKGFEFVSKRFKIFGQGALIVVFSALGVLVWAHFYTGSDLLSGLSLYFDKQMKGVSSDAFWLEFWLFAITTGVAIGLLYGLGIGRRLSVIERGQQVDMNIHKYVLAEYGAWWFVIGIISLIGGLSAADKADVNTIFSTWAVFTALVGTIISLIKSRQEINEKFEPKQQTDEEVEVGKSL